MPTLEFRCIKCSHVTELFFKTISEGERVLFTHCEKCAGLSPKAIVSPPLEAMLYGNPDGYHKPAATKRFSTKTVSQIEGNKSAVG